jgi:light-regulated signal transduction histidine kinase (bacteriophytochrome)
MIPATEPEKSAADKPAEFIPQCTDRIRDPLAILNAFIQTLSNPRFLISPVTSTGSRCATDMSKAPNLFPSSGTGGKLLKWTEEPLRDTAMAVPENADCPEHGAEHKRLKRELHLANKKLHLMNCIAWHEIENKITGARGYVELSKELIKDENGRRYFEAEENILRQIHELLQFTRDYQKIGTRSPQWVNVTTAVQSVLCLVERGSLRMDLDVDASLELFCDPTLEMMFSALIKNTITNKKTAPKIRISVAKTNDELRLMYEDNCPGIPHNRKKRIFSEKIVKSDNFSMKFVHDILEFSGMSITETGDPDRGRLFEITVPKGLYRSGNLARS